MHNNSFRYYLILNMFGRVYSVESMSLPSPPSFYRPTKNQITQNHTMWCHCSAMNDNDERHEMNEMKKKKSMKLKMAAVAVRIRCNSPNGEIPFMYMQYILCNWFFHWKKPDWSSYHKNGMQKWWKMMIKTTHRACFNGWIFHSDSEFSNFSSITKKNHGRKKQTTKRNKMKKKYNIFSILLAKIMARETRTKQIKKKKKSKNQNKFKEKLNKEKSIQIHERKKMKRNQFLLSFILRE